MALKSNSLGVQKLREKVEKEKAKQTAEKTTKPASNKTNQSSTSDKSGIEKLREKVSANNPDYRIGTPLKMGSTPKPITTMVTTEPTSPYIEATKNAYTTAKTSKDETTTFESELSEEARKKRIKEIKNELDTLSRARIGLDRGALYGDVSKMIEQNEAKQAELHEELKKLERTGTFTNSEMLNWEINDASAEVQRLRDELNSYGSRPSTTEIEEYRAKVSERYAAQQKLDDLVEKQKMYKDITEFGDDVKKDDFFGQTAANYRLAELSRDADKAMSDYIDNPTEENLQRAYVYDALVREYQANNKLALDENGQVLPWISKSAAGYMPQFFDQIVPQVAGGVVGGVLGSAVGATGAGAGIGAGLATGIQSYDVMRGSVYRSLLAEGIDEETAMSAANDEALISALIEGGGTALSFALSGGGMALSAIGKAAQTSVAKGSTNAATKFIANLAGKGVNRAAAKASASMGKTAVRTGIGIALESGSEYLEEATQEGVSIANQERAKKGETGKVNLVTNAGEKIWDAVTGKDNETLLQMHEAGKEGAKIGLMLGGTNTVMNNVITHYANAKTVKQQNEILDRIINDEKALNDVIEEGKANGKVSEKIAKEIEASKKKGKVTREQVKRLLASNGVYIENDEKINGNAQDSTAEATANDSAIGDTIPTPESKTAKTTPKPMRAALLEMQMEAMSRENEPVTVEEIKTATAMGDSGAVLVSEIMKNKGVSYSVAKKAVETAYRAGFTDLDESQAPLTTDIQKLAFKAGKADRNADNIIKAEEAKTATVYDGKVEESEYFKKLPPQAQEMAKSFSKDFGMSTRFVERLVYEVYEANAQHTDGVLEVSSDSENPVHEDLIHEALHRMMQVAPEETGLLLNVLYEKATQSGRATSLGININTFDSIKAEHDEAGISLKTLDILEEIGAREMQTIFNSAEEFNEWRAKLETDANLKKGWAKVVEFISELIEKVKQFLKEIGMTAEEKAKAQKEIEILERYANAYKATMNAVAEKSLQKGEEVKANEGYNVKTSNSISKKTKFRPAHDWHTGLTKDQVIKVQEWVNKAGTPESKQITDTSYWYTGRLGGDDLFVIYSTEDSTSTVLYLKKGKRATTELNILKDLLEEKENGESAYGKSSFTQRVSQRNWVQNVNGSQHNIQRLGTAANNRNAGVLPQQSRRRGSRAFENVIKNLFEVQESNASKRGVKTSHSLKTSFSTEGMTENEVENARSVINNLKTRAMGSKYIDGFASYTTERMERELKQSSSRDVIDYAKSYITWVDPTDFIYATTTSEQYRNQLKEEAGSLDLEKLKNETQPIHLTVNFETGEIVGHEGRHRMLALQEKGIDKVAVIIDALNDSRHHTKPIEFMSLKGQRFAEHRKGLDMYLHDMLPLSQRYADTARELFTNKPKSGVQFSLKKPVEQTKAEEQAVNALGEGAETVTDKNGDILIATNKSKNTVMYSLKTYKNGGKKALEKALRANGHTEAEIQETLSYVDDAADYLTILAAGYAKTHNYTALSNHLIADVITNVKTGKQVISSIVNNGEYPVNIDLALICKKRVAYMNLMNRLIDDGVFDKVNYGGEAIAKVNDLLRMDGFETACLGCFVESRRLQFQAWAETIVSEWNTEVDKRKSNAGNFNFADGEAKLTDAELDALTEELKNAGKKNAQGNLNLGRGSVQTKMGRLLDKVPSLQKHLTVADLLKPEGLTALRAYDSNLFSIVKSRYGAASPKIVQDYNPYASEIAMMTFSSVKNITSNAVKGADAYRRKVTNEMGGKPVKQKGETDKAFKERKAEFSAKVEDEAIRRYLYDIGGARIQSFSDFMIENVFDYIQIFADLSAKRLPLHGYTKEIVALRLFGMTGAKWNGSWIAHVDRDMGKEYAGLLPASEAKDGNAILVHTKDGDYAIGFDDYARYKATDKKTFIQSIGMKDMIALQLDPRYSPYVGSITIGVSDKQILAMLDSPLFRFVIPYHSSGMLPQFAKLVGVDLYNDYTDYQNTTVKQWYDAYGNPCDPIRNAKNEVIDVDTSYNFNAEVQKTGDAKKAANNYLKWCGNQHPVYDQKKLVGYVTFSPKFSNSPYGTDFSKHENYYKMLEDFNSYDSVTEQSAVQSAVTMNFPSEENRLTASEMEAYKARLRETGLFSDKEIEKYSAIADKTFKELIADEVKGRAEYQKAQTPKWENTVKNVEDMLLADHKRSNSLKGGKIPSKEATSLLDAVEDLQNGKSGASERLSKYVDSGMISTQAYQEMIKKYGAITEGENPYREVQVPKKTEKDKKVSQTVRTILEARATPDEVLPTIEKMVEDGIFSYDAYTDKKAINDAETYIKEYGWDESLDDWFNDVENGVVSKQHTAMGWALYNNAVNTATTTTSETEKTSAIKASLKILDAMVRHQRSAAQALQATRILKKLSPETQLYGVQKSVSAFQRELTDKYGKKAPDLEIDENLAEQFLQAETQEERDAIAKEIYKDIGRQLPSRFADRWNAWRYLAMLGNLRTHGRNIIGNAAFAPVVLTKDMTATAIENVVYRVSRKKMLRGKSLVLGSKTDRALLSAAWKDYTVVADMISNGGKYNDSALANQNIEEGRRIFKTKPLEWARKTNSLLLETEDMWFSMPHYAYALAQYCKANNITPDQIEKGRAIEPAREYAIKEAQKATYRDANAFSQLVSGLGRSGNNDNVAKKAFSFIVEGILPFRKTPANILVRGVEYSPIGLLKGISYDLVQVGKGKMTASEAIDNISAGLTGTGLLALGVYLASQGLIRGHGEDEKEEKEFKELMGHQSYSLELPGGQSITLDWLAPEALPFFIGVNVWETTQGVDKEMNLSSILKAVSGISEPMLEMSCLQSLNDVIESVGYASSNDTSGLVSIVASAATSYLSQAIPTLFGQAERTGEENRMTTYTEKNNFLTSDVQYTLGKWSAKIPFVDFQQIPYIDAWGRKEASGTALKRGLNNFLNPAYTSTIETSEMEEELLRLYEQTGEGSVFPSRADKYFTVDGKRKDLTADEYVRYATLKGEKSYKLITNLTKSAAYKKLDDGEKVKAIEEAYDYANQKAKQAISNYKPDKWVGTADKFGSDVGNYLAFRADVSDTKTDNGGDISKTEVTNIALQFAQTDSEIWNMYLSMYDNYGATYAKENGVEGETYMNFVEMLEWVDKPTESGEYGSYTQEEVKEAIENLTGLSKQDKAILWQSVNKNWKAKSNPFR